MKMRRLSSLVLIVVSAAVLNEANAGPIWDRARKMFGWDRAEENNNHNEAFAPQYHHGGSSHGYSGGSGEGGAPSPSKGHPSYGPPGPPSGHPSGPSAPYSSQQASGSPVYRPGPSYAPRPDLQHASSALYGAYAPSSYGGPSYMKAPMGSAYGGFPSGAANVPQASYVPSGGSFGGGPYGGMADYGSPSASNNYGGLFSVVDQTSQIGQLANGDLAAAPSEQYGSNEDVMKSLLKMVDKPFDLEAAASGSQYFSHGPQVAFNPGPHPIMETDRNFVQYRTSPIQIGVADPHYGSQRHYHAASQHAAASYPVASVGHHSGHAALSQYGSAGGLGALTAAYGDLHAAASSGAKNTVMAQKKTAQ